MNHDPRPRAAQAGFTLIEMICDVVAVLTIIAAIAIPRLNISKRAANEASAISSLRTVSSAQHSHYLTDGLHTYATVETLRDLKFIDPHLASGSKSGFLFQVSLLHPERQRKPGKPL